MKTTFSFTEEEGLLHDLVLNKENMFVNLNEYIIIKHEFISRKKIFVDFRNIYNIFKRKSFS